MSAISEYEYTASTVDAGADAEHDFTVDAEGPTIPEWWAEIGPDPFNYAKTDEDIAATAAAADAAIASAPADTIWIGAYLRRDLSRPQYELFIANNESYKSMSRCRGPFVYPTMYNSAELNIPRTLLEEYAELEEEYNDADNYDDYSCMSLGEYFRLRDRMEEIEGIVGKLVTSHDAAIRRRKQVLFAWNAAAAAKN